MRQPDNIDCTELVTGDQTSKQTKSGRWVPCRREAHNAWPWTWRFKMAWAVFTGEADALFWEN